MLREHLLKFGPGWAATVPQQLRVGDVAEIDGIGAFFMGHPLPIQRRLARRMPWELPIAVMLMELALRADPESLIMDIGANIGTITVPIALNFPGLVVAYEPVEDTFADLSANLRLNRLENVQAVMKACSASPGSGDMIGIAERNRGLAHLEISQTGKTDVTTVDKESARFGKPVSMIKMDVEGHELSVLDGAKGVLVNDRPLVICEILGKTGKPIFEKMKSLGYRGTKLFRSDWIFHPHDAGAIDRQSDRASGELTL